MYRIKQFISYILSFFYKVDREFIEYYLNDREIYYFNLLLKTERQHSIKVAKKCLRVYKIFNIYDHELRNAIKMCLLHDIGKSYAKLNLFFKPFLVIILKSKKMRKYMFFISKSKVYDYIRHAEYSYNILKGLGYSGDMLNSIRYHHKRGYSYNKYMDLLKYCDNAY